MAKFKAGDKVCCAELREEDDGVNVHAVDGVVVYEVEGDDDVIYCVRVDHDEEWYYPAEKLSAIPASADARD